MTQLRRQCRRVDSQQWLNTPQKRNKFIVPRCLSLANSQYSEIAVGREHRGEAWQCNFPVHPVQAIASGDERVGRIERRILYCSDDP